MKGILLAGGRGSRLYPATKMLSKQVLPVYDKPMIYYPLTTLMLSGIREIMVISTEQDIPAIRSLLGEGDQLGLHLSYAVQPSPNGIAEAFIIGESFLQSEPCALVLGDNLHIFDRAQEILSGAASVQHGATLFAHQVQDPERFGVVTFDQHEKAIELVEKPKNPLSDWAVTGLYFYDGSASKRARALAPSPRGELEITDLNRSYLIDDQLSVVKMSRSSTWMDMGTPDALLEAGNHISRMQGRSGTKIGCVEEVALRQGFITTGDLLAYTATLGKSEYVDYLNALCATR
jgi:glucose-1-phosphate thymidylyltransferase